MRHTMTCCALLVSAACTNDGSESQPREMTKQQRPDVIATNAFYYYNDVESAYRFYHDVLGFEAVVNYGFAKIFRLAEASYLTVVQADEGMHSADEPKVVTLHLVTDELSRWRDYLSALEFPIEEDGGATAGSFVVLDAEGYRLRFVRHNPHPGHDAYVPAFADTVPVASRQRDAGEMGVRATALTVYYPDAEAVRPFFETLFDVQPAGALQGAPVYRMSTSGFVALENYAGPALAAPGENGMTLSFFTGDVDAWFARAGSWPGFELRTETVLNEGGLVRVFVGYDPAGIFLEWDTFLDVAENSALMKYLKP